MSYKSEFKDFEYVLKTVIFDNSQKEYMKSKLEDLKEIYFEKMKDRDLGKKHNYFKDSFQLSDTDLQVEIKSELLVYFEKEFTVIKKLTSLYYLGELMPNNPSEETYYFKRCNGILYVNNIKASEMIKYVEDDSIIREKFKNKYIEKKINLLSIKKNKTVYYDMFKEIRDEEFINLTLKYEINLNNLKFKNLLNNNNKVLIKNH